MELAIFVSLAVLIILVGISLLRGQKQEDVSSKIDSSLKEQFLAFQSNIHNELNSTRQEVARSKDMLNESTIKTLEAINKHGSTIHKLAQQQEDAHKLGQSLKDILQAPKLRGNYGEAVLEEMLERALPKGIWERQYQIDGAEKVDAIVRFKDVIIPIDAKFPRDDYLRYLETNDASAKTGYWKDYETAVKNQIRSISSKYIKPEKGTSEFAVMFIPSEATYYETIADKNHLGQESKLQKFAQDNKVIPVSPNTFYAFLQVIVMSTRNIEILKSAKKLQEGLSGVERSFESFYKKYEDIGKNLEKASESYRVGDSHIERYKRKLDGTLALDGTDEEIEPLPENTPAPLN